MRATPCLWDEAFSEGDEQASTRLTGPEVPWKGQVLPQGLSGRNPGGRKRGVNSLEPNYFSAGYMLTRGESLKSLAPGLTAFISMPLV